MTGLDERPKWYDDILRLTHDIGSRYWSLLDTDDDRLRDELVVDNHNRSRSMKVLNLQNGFSITRPYMQEFMLARRQRVLLFWAQNRLMVAQDLLDLHVNVRQALLRRLTTLQPTGVHLAM